MIHIIIILSLVVSQGINCESVGAAEQVSQPTSQEVHETVQWMVWGSDAFHRAETEDKLILLDLTAVWCHACHVMDETTYVDPTIVRILNNTFVPIRVDTDQHPDIDARYRNGGWPTTSVLLPTGEILFQANALGPYELKEVLQESHKAYGLQKEDFVNRAKNVWKKIEEARKNRSPSRAIVDPEIVDQSLHVISKNFDAENGGFREQPKFFEPEALTLLFQLIHRKPNSSLQKMALFTLNKQRRLIDPVWGGFYRYAEKTNWSHPHFEKMLNIQALNLENYLEAFQVTQDSQYKETVEGIINFINRFLSDQHNGGFYASQDADLRFPNQPDSFVPGERYFLLEEKQRLALGIPLIDKTVYTGWNGLMAKSFLKAYQVLGTASLREFAIKTLERLYQERYRSGEGLAHSVAMGTPKGFTLLNDQVLFASALIEATMTTGDDKYLDYAERVVDDIVKQLKDSRLGGFYDRPASRGDRGLLRFSEKPLEGNVQAAHLLCDLYYITEKQQYHDLAERTLQYVLGSSRPYPLAATALTVHRFHTYPVHVVVVGTNTHAQTQRLFTEGLRLYAPGKIVRLLDPMKHTLKIGAITFPKTDLPRAYICTDQLCTPPIQDPEALEGSLAEVLKGTSQSGSSHTGMKSQG